jgi:subtilisin family serine protease
VNPVFPANYAASMDHVLAVASQRPDGALDPYSHFGATTVALGAPGADVCSLGVVSDTAFVRASGTSYAAPVVAGVAALVRQAFPRLSAADTEALLCATSEDEPGLVDKVRCGAVDADRALHAAWPSSIDGDGVGDPVPMVVGEARRLRFTVDNVAGTESVTVSLVAEGVVAEPVEVALAADDATLVELWATATADGDVTGDVVVEGCCASTSVTWQARGAFPATEATGDTAVPSTSDTAGQDTGGVVADPPVGSTTETSSGCGCQAAPPGRGVSGLLARRRGRTAP